MSQKATFKAQLVGREELELEMELDSATIVSAKLRAIGGPKLLEKIKSYRPHLKGKLADLPVPKGTSTEDILLRELILKAQGRWQYPYDEDELCHCRVIPTAVVDQAICTGAHTPKRVSELTSASTGCGTCRPNVEAIIRYRLGKAS